MVSRKEGVEAVRAKGWYGVVFYDPDPPSKKSRVRVQMVGDDCVFEVDKDDVTSLDDHEYRGSCGQIGCHG